MYIIIWSHGFWPKGSCLILFWLMLLALWLVVYAVMLMINFSFLVVLFGFMQYESCPGFCRGVHFLCFLLRMGWYSCPSPFELPLSPQLQEVDIVLHKATDEIISIELKSHTNFSNIIVYTSGMQDLQRWLFRSIKPYVSQSGLNLVIKEKMNMPMLVIIYSLTWSSYHLFFWWNCFVIMPIWILSSFGLGQSQMLALLMNPIKIQW